jgi:hypothetical protein
MCPVTFNETNLILSLLIMTAIVVPGVYAIHRWILPWLSSR